MYRDSRGKRLSFSVLARGQRAGLVAPARQVGGQELQESRHALYGERAVADILVGEGFLLHPGSHVAGIYAVDAQVGVLGREDVRELFQGGLARACTSASGASVFVL